MTLTLRGYRDEDFAAVVELWTACHLLQPHHDAKRELAFLRAATNAELFLAFEDERLAGSIHIGHDAHRAWMYRLGVAPALRRRGIGRTLVAHAESWTLARGLPAASRAATPRSGRAGAAAISRARTTCPSPSC